LAWDGTGDGGDGNAWGGELLAADYAGFRRVATLRPIRLAGGDAAIRDVWRIALALLDDAFDRAPPLDALRLFQSIDAGRISVVRRMVASGLHAPSAHGVGRYFDAIEYRGKAQADVETLAGYAGVPVYNGLTDEWHPTQMLADFLTMHEASGKDYHELSYAFMGDLRFNMGRSLLVMGALMGSDVRMVGPKELAPPKDVLKIAQDIARTTGARITVTEDAAKGVKGVDFIHTDVWVSMGESKDVWNERVRLLKPFQVNAALLKKTGNPGVKFMHCLPAFHDAETVVGAEIAAATGMTGGLEVTDEIFRSPASIVFDQAENRLHTIKAVLVATLA